MARKKKDGRRATGIQAKKGMLYIVISKNVIRSGKKVNEKKWISTGLTDTPENVLRASDERNRICLSGKKSFIDRDILIPDLVDLYLDQKKRTVADTTYSGYLYRGKKIKNFFSQIKVRDLKQNDVEQFLDLQFRELHSQYRTVKDIKVFFGSMIEFAIKEGLLYTNPVKEATINKKLSSACAAAKHTDDDFFSYDEAQRFLKIAEDHPLYELFFTTLFFGLRREEVLGIRWQSINFKNKTLTINHTVTKGTEINRLNATKTESSTRTYPLTDAQIQLFLHLKEEEKKNRTLFGQQYQNNDYVFKHPDGSLYYPDYPTKAFGKIIKAHPDELPQNVTFHKLRSSCVSLLIHEGFDVKRVQKWVGHADVETTLKIYAKVKDKESKQEILSSMNDMIRPKKYNTVNNSIDT